MEITVTKDNFEREVLQAAQTVLVDFFATWCGPCKMIAPIVKELADEGKAKVCKIDVDEQPELAIRFGVDSIPTLLIFKNGALVNRARQPRRRLPQQGPARSAAVNREARLGNFSPRRASFVLMN